MRTPFVRTPFPRPRLATCHTRKRIHHHRGNPFFQGLGPVYTLSGPMDYTLCPGFPRNGFHQSCFPEEILYAIFFLLCDLGVRRQTNRGGGAMVLVYTLCDKYQTSTWHAWLKSKKRCVQRSRTQISSFVLISRRCLLRHSQKVDDSSNHGNHIQILVRVSFISWSLRRHFRQGSRAGKSSHRGSNLASHVGQETFRSKTAITSILIMTS